MPYAQQYDPRLAALIPPLTLSQFEITRESDDFHIKSWVHIGNQGEDPADSSQEYDDESGDEYSNSQPSDGDSSSS